MAIIIFNGGNGGHTANKGSSAELEAYKEHEMELRIKQNRNQDCDAKCRIFGQDGFLTAEESTRFIDGHRKGLRKDEAKFYEFEINLSEGEQSAMFRNCTTEAEKENIFQEYIRDVVMEEYAKNFKGYTDKDGNAIEFHKSDICWTAVIHTERQGPEAIKWKKEHIDMERADWHAHVTVAHRTLDQTRSISPRKNQRTENNGSCQGYFDRNNFRELIEQTIDIRFGYDRPRTDTIRERQQRREKEKREKKDLDLMFSRAREAGREEARQLFTKIQQKKHLQAEKLKAKMEREAAERRAARQQQNNTLKPDSGNGKKKGGGVKR